MNNQQVELNMSMKCIKYMIFVANFMFAMIGFLLISIGSTVISIYNDFDVFMQDSYFSPGKLAIAIGIIMLFVSLFGCVGAFKESTCLIKTFAFCLTAVLILEIAAAITAYTMRSNLRGKIEDEMLYALVKFDHDYYNYGWNNVQEQFHCCGVDGPKDWKKFANQNKLNINITRNNENYKVPDSCCVEYNTEQCQQDQKIYISGCLSKLTYIVSECALLLGVGALCVSFIQLLGIIFAHMLAKSIRRLKTQILVQRQENRKQLYEQLAKGNPEKVTPVLYTPTSSEA